MQYHAPDEAELNRFHEGNSDCAYHYLGAHPVPGSGK